MQNNPKQSQPGSILVVSPMNCKCETPKEVKNLLTRKFGKTAVKYASPECKSFEKMLQDINPIAIVLERIGKRAGRVLKTLQQRFPNSIFFSVGDEVPGTLHCKTWEGFQRYAAAA